MTFQSDLKIIYLILKKQQVFRRERYTCLNYSPWYISTSFCALEAFQASQLGNHAENSGLYFLHGKKPNKELSMCGIQVNLLMKFDNNSTRSHQKVIETGPCKIDKYKFTNPCFGRKTLLRCKLQTTFFSGSHSTPGSEESLLAPSMLHQPSGIKISK